MQTFMDKLARFFALLGGTTLTILILLICASVVGRSLNGVLHSDAVQAIIPGIANGLLNSGIGPINGDFEIVEAGVAFAIFAFLPICQLHGAHASVGIFTQRLPEQLDRKLRLVIEVVFAAVLILLAWYLLLGGLSKYQSGQTTLLLQFPVWWSYALCIVAMWVGALTGLYVAAERIMEVLSGRKSHLAEDGANH